MFLEDAEDQTVDCWPAVLPEERQEPLHKVQWNALCHEAHDPVGGEHHHPHVLVKKM